MLALAAASAVEGVCKVAAGDAGLPSEHRAADVAAVRKRLKSWKRFTGIRDRLLPPLEYIGQPSVRAFLGHLVKTSAISSRHRDAWTHVRNRVAHGVLGDPWSDEESDQRLVLLLEPSVDGSKAASRGHFKTGQSSGCGHQRFTGSW